MKDYRSEARKMLVSGDLEGAIRLMVNAEPRNSDLTRLSARFRQYLEDKNLGTTGFEQLNVVHNQLLTAMSDILDGKTPKPGEAEEKEQLYKVIGAIVISLIVALFSVLIFTQLF